MLRSILFVLCLLHASLHSFGQETGRPNIIVIVVDDLRWDEFGLAGHPYLETPNIDRLCKEGAWFTNAFHAVPLCSPNRASILTGQYPSRHGIIDNVARNQLSHKLQTYPIALQKSGYRTGFLGKWHMGNDPTPRPGFDYWSALPGQGRIHDPILYENGQLNKVPGYVTDVLTDRAVAFVKEAKRDQPFFLHFAHKAIHPDIHQLDDGSVDKSQPGSFTPASRHAGRYKDAFFERRKNVPSKPEDIASLAVRQALEQRNSSPIKEDWSVLMDPGTSEKTIRDRAEMLLSIDDGIGRIITALEEESIFDQTVLVITSDNGYFYGEHGLSIERRMPFEESIRNPLIVRYPPLIKKGTRIDQLVSSIDIAPSMLELARAPIGDHIQGQSFAPFFKDAPIDWRDAILVEFYTYENPMPWLMEMDYRVVRTRQYKYIHWMKHPPELYDLKADPYEENNLIDNPKMNEIATRLRAKLGRLTLEALGLSEENRR